MNGGVNRQINIMTFSDDCGPKMTISCFCNLKSETVEAQLSVNISFHNNWVNIQMLSKTMFIKNEAKKIRFIWEFLLKLLDTNYISYTNLDSHSHKHKLKFLSKQLTNAVSKWEWLENQSISSHHNDDTERAGRRLFVHLVEQVVADDVDETGAEAVPACHNYINAVGSHWRQPSAESLREKGEKS